MARGPVTHRDRLLKGAIEIELISVGWIMTEAILAAIAAYRAGSLSLSAFSVDSSIELLSGMMLVVRLYVEIQSGEEMTASHKVERWTSGVISWCLFTLAAYISYRSGQLLHVRAGSAMTLLGLVTAAASSVITPWLAWQKLRYGRLLHSPSLIGDAMCGFTCASMSWTLLLGLGLNSLFHWWWVDVVAAVGILYFILQEAWESWHSFQSGEPHVHDHTHFHRH
ncbi:cation transporter [Alicyclobacillus fastidiosus]|uniref:Cation transporter n=1 Tax=Alicyclobacillus fastidiosus TaxID=392011 RepID=A0ABV5AE96_9BACL|nr:cation transporter [Alicyclobacillus fastidiosus]WEH11329.1 cation transporter [Alicyclobacillus fastidiosus]